MRPPGAVPLRRDAQRIDTELQVDAGYTAPDQRERRPREKTRAALVFHDMVEPDLDRDRLRGDVKLFPHTRLERFQLERLQTFRQIEDHESPPRHFEPRT